jgi:hypothetical protein
VANVLVDQRHTFGRPEVAAVKDLASRKVVTDEVPVSGPGDLGPEPVAVG